MKYKLYIGCNNNYYPALYIKQISGLYTKTEALHYLSASALIIMAASEDNTHRYFKVDNNIDAYNTFSKKLEN